MRETARRGPGGWLVPAAVFVGVIIPQLALVAAAGTDIPFYDQWNIEGQWLYPAWRDGSLSLAGLMQPFNEHRILWTHLLNLTLLVLNGQWDPLLQMVAIAVLRAACAAGLAWYLARGRSGLASTAITAGVVGAFLPHLAWHNVLWGIESHAYFSLGLSLLALALLGREQPTWRHAVGGCVVGFLGLFAMGPGALVPVALVGLALLRLIERRRFDRTLMITALPALVLLSAGLAMRVAVPEHAPLQAQGVGEFLVAAGRVLSWPHGNGLVAALLLNAPLLAVVIARSLRRRTAVPGEDFVVLVGGWSAAIGLATAWVRGGGVELAAGLPSRYVDFIVLLPLANAWCGVRLMREAMTRGMRSARPVAAAWGVFLLVGWLGVSAEVWRGLILPRARDREAPVRLMRTFQLTGNSAVFVGQPRLLVPHPNLESVRAVLNDPRLRGVLPPSLQPERPMGPLSRAARWLLGRQ